MGAGSRGARCGEVMVTSIERGGSGKGIGGSNCRPFGVPDSPGNRFRRLWIGPAS